MTEEYLKASIASGIAIGLVGYIIYRAALKIFGVARKATDPTVEPGLPIGTHGKFTDADTDDIDLDDQISRFRFTSK